MATLQELRDGFLQEYLGSRAYKKLSTGLGATGSTITITSGYLPDSDADPLYFVGFDMFRASLAVADADRERFVTQSSSTASTLTLTHTGPTYADTTMTNETVYLIKLPNLWTVENDLHTIINAGLRKCLYEDELPVGNFIADGDMRSSGTSDWGSSNATLSKVTTAAHAWQNRRAMFVNLTGSSGYAESQAFDVEPNTDYVITVVAKVVSGSAVVTAWDNTNSAALDTFTWSSTPFTFLNAVVTTATNQRSMKLRIGGSGATDDVYYSYAIVHNMNDRYATLPSYIQDDDQVRDYFTYVPTVSASGESDVWLADSVKRRKLEGNTEVHPHFATDARAWFPRAMGQWPIMADIVRPGIFALDTSEDLVEETDTTPVPYEYALPHIASEFWRRFTLWGPGSDIYDEKQIQNLQRAEAECQRVRLAYKPRTNSRRRPSFVSRQRFGGGR